jgi:para-aminobenzoate synthetase/4-amino-4-deoxychorismate lyase
VLRDAATERWLRFSDPVEIVSVNRIDDVVDALSAVEARVAAENLYAAGFVSYEAAPAFDRALEAGRGDVAPLLWFGLFRNADEVPAPESVDPSPALDWAPDVSRTEFNDALQRIKTHIADGDTYQVNYTFRLRAAFDRTPWRLFCELVHAQDAAYAVYIDTGALALCSVSPELFFQVDGDILSSRPMKGTAPRGRSAAEDVERAEWLHASEKNRAENVMIVDMIRNDIGRVADVGSVRVTDLFRVEQYPTLWQMTSTVTGRTRSSVAAIMTALFPCASITGAPKARTTGIIRAIEAAPRGIYTGAIGFIAPGRRAQFSVAIRTVVVNPAAGTAEYGVGAGVTWESDAADEYDECLTKARVLTERRPSFELLETLRWTRRDGYRFLDEHINRACASADYFGFRPANNQHRELIELTPDVNVAAGAIRALLSQSAGEFPTDDMIVRLLIDKRGTPRVESRPFVARAEPVTLRMATSPVNSQDVFLFHKTTNRAVYERASTDHPDADDVVLWNERGEVTETCIANLIVDIDGELVTPPLSCGLLPGIGRADLIARGDVHERVVTVDELARARAIWVVNSVRGRQRARLVGAPS